MNKKLFLYVAATAVLASCSDDLQLQQAETVTTMNGVQGKLVKAGFLGGSQAVDETRAFTAKANFVWMADNDDLNADGSVKDGKYPQIGLCWTGVNPNEPEYGAAKEASANVFTNYLYEQVGWLRWGDKALEYDECSEEVYNGAFYVGVFDPALEHDAYFKGYGVGETYPSDINGYKEYAGGGSANHKSSRYNAYYYSEAQNKVLGRFKYKNPYTGVTNTNEDLNLGAGIFKTENSSVFEGQYIVYFPYNEDFKKGPIMARVGDSFTMDVNDDKYAIVSENAFQLGVIQNYGGVVSGKNREANFTTKNYSSTAQIHLVTDVDKEVRAVILYSAKDGIVYEAGIKANSVVAAKGDMSKVEQVEGSQKHNHAVYTYLENSLFDECAVCGENLGAHGTATVCTNAGCNSNLPTSDPNYEAFDVVPQSFTKVLASENHTKESAVKVPLPVLPCQVSDLQIIVMFSDYSTKITKVKDVEFVAGKAKDFYINLSQNENYIWDEIVGLKDNGYIAVDEESLVNAAGILYTTPKDGTIKLLRPIDLGADVNEDGVEENATLYKKAGMPNAGELAFKSNVTIEADPSTLKCKKCEVTAGLIVKSLPKSQTIRGIESYDATKKLQMLVPVIVEGTGCCAELPAVLNLGGNEATYKDVITFVGKDSDGNDVKASLTNYGNTNVGSQKGKNHEVTFADVINTYDDVYVTAKGYTKGAYGKNTAMANPTINTLLPANHGKYNAVFNIMSSEKIVVLDKMNSLTNYGWVNQYSENALTTADETGNRSLKVEIATVENYGLAAGADSFVAAVDAAKPGVTTALVSNVRGGSIKVSQKSLLTVGTINNNNAFAYVHTEGKGLSSTNDARIDVNNSNGSANKGTWDNFGVTNFLGGNYDNTEGLLIDQLTGQIGGLRIKNGDVPTTTIKDYIAFSYDNESAQSKKFDLVNYTRRYVYGAEDKDEYQTDLNTGIYVAKVATEDRLAFLLNDAVEQKSVNLVEFAKRTDGGIEDLQYDFSDPIYNGKDLGSGAYDYDVKISLAGVIFRNREVDGGDHVGVSCVGHCLDVWNTGFKFSESAKLSIEKNLFVRTQAVEVTATAYNAELEVGNNVYLEKGTKLTTAKVTAVTVPTGYKKQVNVKHDVIMAETSDLETSRVILVGNDVQTGGHFLTNDIDAYFHVSNDVFIGNKGFFESKGTPNVVEHDFDLYGVGSAPKNAGAWFARYTTTTMGVEKNGAFRSWKKSKFEREQLSGWDVYRATVNVNNLAKTEGTTTTGWPTQIDF